jgi:hypothetical protein
MFSPIKALAVTAKRDSLPFCKHDSLIASVGTTS